MNCAIHTQTPATAFCRTCGKALCENCKRDVMGAIYCEPCIAVRLQGAVPVAPAPVPVTGVEGAPSPALATLLGFLPGVGAMYNNQFVKAFVHVAIFVLLVVATRHISGLIGILIGFFIIYMAFEAHQTAKARRVGQPTPDHLGLEQLFGIQENHPPQMGSASAAIPAQTPANLKAEDHAPTSAVVLIVLGVIFLVSRSFDMDIDKIWPIFFIVLGLWLAYKRTSTRA
ncbi:MAG TPA: B-box zinc finger protein [Candidatus Angelobacter sp.]